VHIAYRERRIACAETAPFLDGFDSVLGSELVVWDDNKSVHVLTVIFRATMLLPMLKEGADEVGAVGRDDGGNIPPSLPSEFIVGHATIRHSSTEPLLREGDIAVYQDIRQSLGEPHACAFSSHRSVNVEPFLYRLRLSTGETFERLDFPRNFVGAVRRMVFDFLV
jgi:hypothetical protein